ncbi:MAG: amidase [Polyangiaceae bacterium]|nr:amidase [Polyangiaceae bacterium]
MKALYERGAVELASMLRRREVSAVEVVDAHIARIEAVNGAIRAVVRTCFERARQEAAEADERLSTTTNVAELPPFLGVPFTSKEHFAVEGLPNTGGLVSRRNKVATADATIVERMRRAGFILLGTTNVPEGLVWYETYNHLYGRTNNPFALDRIPGGSSGGEAAIIAAQGSPIGLGGDMGGSIRLPAFFCGIAGHKPSGGRLPETGAWPGARGKIARYKVVGPMARTIADLRAVLPILEGPDGHDLSVDAPPLEERPFEPKNVRVYYFDDNDIMSPSDDVRDAVARSARALAALGCKVEPWRPPSIKRSVEMWFSAMSTSGGPTFREVIADGGELELAKQWRRFTRGSSDHIFPVLGLATLEGAIKPFARARQNIAGLREVLQREIEEKLGDDGVLLFPVFHRPAPKHGWDAVRHFLGFSYSGVLNPLEMPSTAVPTGLTPSGLPVGVQVAARRNGDDLTLCVASWIERELGGYRAPALGPTPKRRQAPARPDHSLSALTSSPTISST